MGDQLVSGGSVSQWGVSWSAEGQLVSGGSVGQWGGGVSWSVWGVGWLAGKGLQEL